MPHPQDYFQEGPHSRSLELGFLPGFSHLPRLGTGPRPKAGAAGARAVMLVLLMTKSMLFPLVLLHVPSKVQG